mmetsp:Transcript_33466/g.61860  ORF Transcript_33466/g.61860 Transcript_33466/m.61860 type:complete len:262 (-) Transcript_33466:153-938(-)
MRIVILNGVRNHQVWLSLCGSPVGHVITVRVAVILEASLVQQPSCVHRGCIATIPAQMCHIFDANCSPQRLHCQADMFSFHLLRHVVLGPPSPTVATDVNAIPMISDVSCSLRQHLEGERASVQSAREPPVLKHLHDPPEPDSAAVLKQRFRAHISGASAKRASSICEHDLSNVVTVVEGCLRALLKIDNQIDSELGSPRPLGVGIIPSVALQVSWRPCNAACIRRGDADEAIAALAHLCSETWRKGGLACSLHHVRQNAR